MITGWAGRGEEAGVGGGEFAPKWVIRCKKRQFCLFFVLSLDPEDPGMLVQVYIMLYPSCRVDPS